MSRLDIKTQNRAQTVVDNLYRDVERRIAASPPGLCPVDSCASLRRSLARHQPSGLPRPVPLGRGPRKVFFAAYTPPQKADYNLFAACGPRTR
mgnify:CR=1 FL=1